MCGETLQPQDAVGREMETIMSGHDSCFEMKIRQPIKNNDVIMMCKQNGIIFWEVVECVKG
jgi:hypothetical protein